jgi:hypothetical protein
MRHGRKKRERRERVRLGLLAGSKGYGGLHESQTLKGGMKKTSGRYIGFPYKTGYITLDARPNLLEANGPCLTPPFPSRAKRMKHLNGLLNGMFGFSICWPILFGIFTHHDPHYPPSSKKKNPHYPPTSPPTI